MTFAINTLDSSERLLISQQWRCLRDTGPRRTFSGFWVVDVRFRERHTETFAPLFSTKKETLYVFKHADGFVSACLGSV